MPTVRATKAELAKRGDARITSFFVICGIIFYFIWWPLAIVIAIGFIFYKKYALSEIKAYEASGEVHLGMESIDLINLDTTFPEATPLFVVMDVETTGLLVDDTLPTIKKVKENPDWYPNIVQMAWVTMDKNYCPIQIHSFYVKQKGKIPEKAIEVHGITDAICENQGAELEKVLEAFRESISQCDYYVGHNAQFDKYVVEAECIKNNLPKPFKYMKMYDTMKMGTTITGRHKSTLLYLAERVFGKEVLSKAKLKFHDAKSDVILTASIFKALHSQGIKY